VLLQRHLSGKTTALWNRRAQSSSPRQRQLAWSAAGNAVQRRPGATAEIPGTHKETTPVEESASFLETEDRWRREGEPIDGGIFGCVPRIVTVGP
jgi:hypothetical protein